MKYACLVVSCISVSCHLVMIQRARELFSVENVFQSAAPFHKFSTLFGIALYSFNPQNGEIKGTLISRIVLFMYCLVWMTSVLVVILYIYIVTIAAHVDMPVDKDSSRFLSNVNCYQFSMVFVFAVFIILFDYRKKNHSQSFLRKIHEFDVLIRTLQWKKLVENSWMYMIFIVPMPIVLLVHSEVTLPWDRLQEQLIVILAMINTMIYVCATSQLVLSLLSVISRLNSMNKNLM